MSCKSAFSSLVFVKLAKIIMNKTWFLTSIDLANGKGRVESQLPKEKSHRIKDSRKNLPATSWAPTRSGSTIFLESLHWYKKRRRDFYEVRRTKTGFAESVHRTKPGIAKKVPGIKLILFPPWVINDL